MSRYVFYSFKTRAKIAKKSFFTPISPTIFF